MQPDPSKPSPTQSEPKSQPVVCTLTTKGMAQRALEWTDLAELSTTVERIEGGVRSTFPVKYEAQIRDLAEREADCCGTWLRTSTQVFDDRVHLELTTENPDGVEVILAMATPADADDR